jgi:hypothetical protein
MPKPIKTLVKTQQLEELKNMVNVTTNPEEKEKLKKKIAELENQLGTDDSIYKI